MKNPMETGGIFNVEDVSKYKEYLEDSILQSWNDYCSEGLEVNSFDEVDMGDEGFGDDSYDLIGEYEEVKSFLEDVEGYGSEEIIHEDEFEDYCRNLVEDCYDLSSVPGIIMNNTDWGGVSEDMRQDYPCIEYKGDEFYVR